MNSLSHRQATARVRLMNPDGTICAGQEVQADCCCGRTWTLFAVRRS